MAWTLVPALLALGLQGTPELPPGMPRPEHPRPDLYRTSWLNLNGYWEFLETDEDGEAPLGQEPFPEIIRVPFCREAPLSGLGRRGFVRNVWYRRRFTVPPLWRGRRVFLHVGASDWKTTVWVNGVRLGEHTGGSAPFAFEVTGVLRWQGPDTVVVHAFDDTRSGLQQLGKQARTPESAGIFYTRTTGIWQTVWLEAVGTTFVRDLHLQGDPDSGEVTVDARVDGPWSGLVLAAELQDRIQGGPRVATAEAPLRSSRVRLRLVVPDPHPWTPKDPHLYSLHLVLRGAGGQEVDRVQSYLGLRRIAIDGTRILLNGRPVFLRMVLDQGFYPGGVWTAPTDSALRRDIQLAKAAGFHGARLHQKVFEPRYHYWADRLGFLTWGESPSFGADYGNPAVDQPVVREWVEILLRDRNHPSILGWCPFNETPAAAARLQDTLVDLTHALDPGRPVLDTSGWTHSSPARDLDDAHDYEQDPERFRTRWASLVQPWRLPARYGIRVLDRPFWVSEFGGIGWIPPGEDGWGYGDMPRTETEFLDRLDGLTAALLDNPAMCGFCWTQLTDVEQERNGLFYADRRPKFPVAELRRRIDRPAACESGPGLPPPEDLAWEVLSPAAVDPGGPATWLWTTTAPPAGWTAPDFPAAWPEGAAGFGRKEGFPVPIGTPWTGPDLWLRREVAWDGRDFLVAVLVMHHDDAVELYLNGDLLQRQDGWNDAYQAFPVTEQARKLLRPGRNVLAAHVHQDGGGQYFDAALLLGRKP